MSTLREARQDNASLTAGDIAESSHEPEVTVVIPCLNERITIVEAVVQAKAAFANWPGGAEVIVADNTISGTVEKDGKFFGIYLSPAAGTSAVALKFINNHYSGPNHLFSYGGAPTNPNITIAGSPSDELPTGLVAGFRKYEIPSPLLLGPTGGACILRGGTGVPDNAMGSNGEFFFRDDGGSASLTHVYYKAGGAWTGIA